MGRTNAGCNAERTERSARTRIAATGIITRCHQTGTSPFAPARLPNQDTGANLP